MQARSASLRLSRTVTTHRLTREQLSSLSLWGGATTAMALWGMHQVSGPLVPFVVVLAATITALALYDLEQRRLPDWLTLTLVIGGLLCHWRTGTASGPFIAGAILAAVLLLAVRSLFLLTSKVDALGLGDVKLAGAAGIWLGWSNVPLFLMLATFGGVGWYVMMRAINRDAACRTDIPFGIPLCFALWLVWLRDMAV